jgi:vacuolar-type H+-ATPase subunit H
MPKPKSRIRRLAEALEELQRTQEKLLAIDLRQCKEPTRTHVKEARARNAETIAATEAAMRTDVPLARKDSSAV